MIHACFPNAVGQSPSRIHLVPCHDELGSLSANPAKIGLPLLVAFSSKMPFLFQGSQPNVENADAMHRRHLGPLHGLEKLSGQIRRCLSRVSVAEVMAAELERATGYDSPSPDEVLRRNRSTATWTCAPTPPKPLASSSLQIHISAVWLLTVSTDRSCVCATRQSSTHRT